LEGFGDVSSLSGFDYCRTICRTSSKSIHSHNQYRNNDKYCYSLHPPPLQNDTLEGNINRIKIAGKDEKDENEVDVVKEVKFSSLGMHVGDGERREQTKFEFLEMFSNDGPSSIDMVHSFRILMLAFLIYYTWIF